MQDQASSLAIEFSDLVISHYDSWLRVAFSQTRNTHDAHDLVQSAIQIGLEKLQQLESIEKGPAWMTRILMNLHKTQCRRKKIEQRVLEDIVSESVENSQSESLSAILDNPFAWLRVAASGLPTNYHPVARALVEYEGDTARVADKLGVSTAVVRQKKLRMRRYLEDSLGTGNYLRVLAVMDRLAGRYIVDRAAKMTQGYIEVATFVREHSLPATAGMSLYWGARACDTLIPLKPVIRALARAAKGHLNQTLDTVRRRFEQDFVYHAATCELGAAACHNAISIGMRGPAHIRDEHGFELWLAMKPQLLSLSRLLLELAGCEEYGQCFDRHWKTGAGTGLNQWKDAAAALTRVLFDLELIPELCA